MKIVQKDWGYEEIIENNEKYCLKRLTCLDEKWSSKGKYHYHPIKDETFYIIEGTLEIDVEVEDGLLAWYMDVGNSYRIKPGMKHRFRSVGKKCRFIEASTTHSDYDTVRVRFEVIDKIAKWVEED